MRFKKLIRDVNRKPALRKSYFDSPPQFVQGYDLTDEERSAIVKLDIGAALCERRARVIAASVYNYSFDFRARLFENDSR